jgi:hypothetical protein
MTPLASDVVVTLNGAWLTTMLSWALLVAGVGVCESVTVTVKVELPVVPFGMPEITPVLLKFKPAGKLPAVRLQL